MVKTTLVGLKLNKEEYVQKIEELNVEEQELRSKLNQVHNFMALLKLKKIRLNETLDSIEDSRQRATEIFKKIKYVRKIKNDKLETEWESLLKKTGLEKNLAYKEDGAK